MASKVQQLLSNLAITPPPGAWPAIEDRLQKEFDPEETVVAQKLDDFAVMPPVAAWENIAAALPTEKTPVLQPAKVMKLPYRRVRMLAAAAVIGLVGLIAWYFLNYEESVTGTGNSVVKQNQAVAPSTQNKPAPVIDNDLPVPETADNNPDEQLAQKTSEPATRYASQQVSTRPSGYMVYRFDDQPMATVAGMPEEEGIRFTANVSPEVEAPLIRDANGKIILDKRLITSPDNCYITITGPNGEQTRISSKFLDIIPSLNAETAQPSTYFDFMMQENSWQSRFRDWKNKMTATNIFDILELKELLQENQ